MFLVLLICQLVIVNSYSGSWDWSGSGSGSGSGESSGDSGEEMGSVRSVIYSTAVRSKVSTAPTFHSIINQSLHLITGELGTPVKLRKILDKHFFTGKKSESIWPKAIEESKKMFGVKFNERDLDDMQATLRNIYRGMMYCDEKLTKRDRKHRMKHAECYEMSYDAITEADADFGFPSGSSLGISRILNLNIGYNLMRLLYLELTQQLALTVGLQPMNVTKNIYLVAEDIFTKYSTVLDVVENARADQVSDVEVCSVQEIFFTEFVDTCRAASSKLIDDISVAGSTSPDPFKLTFRAKVIDRKDGKEVCNLVSTTGPQRDSQKVRKDLTEKCNERRNEYVKKLAKQTKAALSKSAGLISQELPSLWKRKSKTLRKLKAELDSKISQQQS